MFVHKVATDLSSRLCLPCYSLNSETQKAELIRGRSWKFSIEKSDRPACFGPIRAGAAEPIFPSSLDEYNIILHLRDPRDALVSLFFSHTYSHTRTPGRFNPSESERRGWEEGGVDAFVLQWLPEYCRRYQSLVSHLLDRDNVTYLRYEDMIGNLEEWLGSFLSAFHHLNIPQRRALFRKHPQTWEEMRSCLLQKFRNEFKIPKENVYRHKRQMLPGDYRRKLKPETIQKLSESLGPLLVRLGYES